MRGYHVATLILAYTAACTTSDRVTDVFLVHYAYSSMSTMKEQKHSDSTSFVRNLHRMIQIPPVLPWSELVEFVNL